jgi:hypothetical protein
MIRGSIGFAFVSLAAFSVWAFAGQWLETRLGEGGLYAACALVFLALSGLLLHPLVPGPHSLLRFYQIFIPAFLAYAIVWCAVWFILRFGPGEWLASFLATAAFAGVVTWRFHHPRSFFRIALVLFIANSAGYFLGGQLMRWLFTHAASSFFSGLSRPSISLIAKLAWGLLYGLGFGAGIGYAFQTAQDKCKSASLR